MDDPLRVRMIERGGKAFNDQCGIAQGEFPLSDHLRKGSTRHITHHKIRQVIIFSPNIVDRDNGWVFQ